MVKLTASAESVEDIKQQMIESYTVDGKLTDGGVGDAHLKFTDGRELRRAFTEVSNLVKQFPALYRTKKGHSLISSVDGFRNSDDAMEKFYLLQKLFAAFVDWKVDGYVNLLRLMKGTKEFTEGELTAIVYGYVEGGISNQTSIEEIIDANLYE